MSNFGEKHLRQLIDNLDGLAHPTDGLWAVHSPQEILAVSFPGDQVVETHKLDYHIDQVKDDPKPRGIFPRIVTATIGANGLEEQERFVLEPTGITYMGADRISTSFGSAYMDAMIGCAERMLGQMVEYPVGTNWNLELKSGKWTK